MAFMLSLNNGSLQSFSVLWDLLLFTMSNVILCVRKHQDSTLDKLYKNAVSLGFFRSQLKCKAEIIQCG